jgi:hypothetical protein
MPSMIQFLAARLLTRSFWLLVLSTFLGVLLMSMRSSFRDQIFKIAVETRKKKYYATRF